MSLNTKAVPFFKPYIRGAEIRAVRKVLKSGWLTTGLQTRTFEEEFSRFLIEGNRSRTRPIYSLAVNSATSGLHLALEAAGVGPGDSVAVPTMTFTASAEVIRYLGADPVFIDSLSETGNLNPEELRKVIENLRLRKKSLKAVIAVHLAGLPCDMEAISEILSGTGITLIEDAAHSFPSRTADGMAGTLGDIGVFSFYATKTITTGEGGMVVTRNPEYAERMRIMRLHGIDRSVWNRYTTEAGDRSWEYDVVEAGYKYNMTDIAAALGRVQLGRADSLLKMRRDIADRYDAGLDKSGITTLSPKLPGHSRHLYIISARDSESRDRIVSRLSSRKIGSSMHFIPLHRMTYWKNRYQLNAADFPVAEEMAERNMSLPLWPGMSRATVRKVIRIVREAADE